MSRKELKSWCALMFSVAIAIIWNLLIKFNLFFQPILPLAATTNEIEAWVADVFWLNNIITLVLGFGLLGFWIWMAYTQQFIRAELVITKRALWYFLLLFHFIASFLIFLAVSYFVGWLDDGRYLEFLGWYFPCLFIDTFLLFWFPSALATPRSMRNIPWLASTLRKLYGG